MWTDYTDTERRLACDLCGHPAVMGATALGEREIALCDEHTDDLVLLVRVRKARARVARLTQALDRRGA